jgi:recombinational DNA repair protein (RecF pathway)
MIIFGSIFFTVATAVFTSQPDSGKLSLMAKGVRKVKSKLAGGIELFSTSEITYIPGRGSVGTLVSSRLMRHYGGIV